MKIKWYIKINVNLVLHGVQTTDILLTLQASWPPGGKGGTSNFCSQKRERENAVNSGHLVT